MNDYQEHSRIEPLLEKPIKKWTESELSCYETPLFSILPSFVFKARTKTLIWLHRTVFRTFNIEFTIGGILFILAISSIIGYEEYSYYANRYERYRTGILAAYIGALIFTFSSKNSVWSLITGASWERILIIHKILFFFLAIAIGFHLVYFLTSFLSLSTDCI